MRLELALVDRHRLIFQNDVPAKEVVLVTVLLVEGEMQIVGEAYRAWIMPGMYPRMVSRMLMSKSAPQPRSRKTPRGGRMMARMILQISLLRC